MSSLPDPYPIIQHHLLFHLSPEEVIERFAKQAQVRLYPKGSSLFLHEEKADHFFIVIRGWIKLFRETLDGSEVIIDILNEGHLFGETSIFEQDLYPYGAQAIEESIVIQLPLHLLKEEIKTNNQLCMQIFNVMSRFRKQQDLELEHRDVQSAPQRIGCFLLRLCPIDNSHEATIHLPYDKTLIATRLGMKPETFSRALTRLKNETNITIHGATIYIPSIAQLSSYSCSACSSSYPCRDLT